MTTTSPGRAFGLLRHAAARVFACVFVCLLAHQAVQAQPAAPDVKRLRLMTTSDVQIGGPWFVAAGKDFFKAEGFENVEIVQYPSAPPAFPAFITDDIQAMAVADQPMFALAAGGQPLSVFGIYSDMTGLHGLIGSAAVKTAKDLEGKNVALPKGSVLEFYLRRFCEAYGCDLSKVKVINMSAPEAVTALVAGSVDAAALWQPFIDRAIAGKPELHMLHYQNVSRMPHAEGPKRLHNATAVLFTKQAFAKEHPSTVDALLRVLDRSMKYMAQNPKDAAALMAKALKIEPDTALRYEEAVRFGFNYTPQNLGELQSTANRLAEEKLIKRDVNFEREMLDPRPYRQLGATAAR
ncbi:MAG TPA: ABC transporter substrate-binding protein [Ramlibacter sp.]|uniref:ABC transporter substrate-binding protein n=1 Tax=Ramlibacter sp. TaxID=1917967 RepID=UPI002C103544|nr:ABC transporter substrate-binding protein [Ramlibacter sp.]HVZ46346.1 ABC transporter substrate-binding protein [Ramlibacter sp.]